MSVSPLRLYPGFLHLSGCISRGIHTSRVYTRVRKKKRKEEKRGGGGVCRRVYPRGVGRKRAKKAAVTAFYLHTASPFSSASSLSTPALFAFRNWPATTAATSFLPSFLPACLARSFRPRETDPRSRFSTTAKVPLPRDDSR